MPENSRDMDRLFACEAISIGSVTLLPIGRLTTQSQTASTYAWLTASKEPVALIVRDRDAVEVIQFGMSLSIEQLRAQIPRLDDLIEPN